jgi:hypothetical protein
MTITVTHSIQAGPAGVAEDLATAFSEIKPALVLFFASSRYDPGEISSQIKEKFPDATVVGCSTAGEIVSGHVLKNSVVAMALESDVISAVASGIIDLNSRQSPSDVVFTLADAFGCKPLDLNPSQYVGVILIDGLSCAEEKLMEKIGDLVNITVIGGSAGDDLAFQKTWVYLDGKAYENSAVLLLIKPGCHFDIIKTQSFCGMNRRLTPTLVDEESRKVIEFNGKPAVTAYAEAIGVSESEAPGQFMSHPVGLISGDEPFVRSPQRIEETSLYFYCQIKSGIDLEVLSSTDMIADTRQAVETMMKKAGTIKGLINFNCILRTLQLEQEQKTEDYGKIFQNVPMIGFSTYGEEYIGHINQTATMLVFY